MNSDESAPLSKIIGQGVTNINHRTIYIRMQIFFQLAMKLVDDVEGVITKIKRQQLKMRDTSIVLRGG